MKVLDPGHRYLLNCLDEVDGEWKESLVFVKRDDPPEKYPGNVGHHPGTTIQEVLRALIERCRYVEAQLPNHETRLVVEFLQRCIHLLESRAAHRSGRQLPQIDESTIETIPTCPACGHIYCEEHQGNGR